MLADSHCHLDCLPEEEVAQAIIAARAKGVKYILCPGISIEGLPKILSIVAADADLFAAVGVHPTEEKAYQPSLQELITLAQHKKVVGVGETGLDFYYGNDAIERARQLELFKLHIQAAKELHKPLIIHSRAADEMMVKILTAMQADTVGGVMHCFTGSLALAKAVIEMGFYVSFSGIITFHNAQNLCDIIKHLPLEKILVETDAPYLAPVPMRGKPNEPAYLVYTAEFIADLLGISYASFADYTTTNFLRFCKL